MPKRHGNLYDGMFTLDALYQAYLTSRKRKRKKSAVYKFERDLGANLLRLYEELKNGFYNPRPYKTFYVYEPKPRLIFAPHFRDVVVQHAMYSVLYPIMDKTFSHESFGCRLNKGTHRSADQAQRYLRASPENSFILQFDIRKFFYRIDRDILLSLWEKKIKDIRVLNLIKLFANYPDGTGIPIGNLLSQLGALVYLNPLDHFVKRVLKVERYTRYVDDFIIFGVTKTQAAEYRDLIQNWLKSTLNLELSKWIIQPVKRGVNFVGFRTWRSTRFVRKQALYNFKRALTSGNHHSINSCLNHAVNSASHLHYTKLMNEAALCI